MDSITFYNDDGRIDYSVSGNEKVIADTIQNTPKNYVEGHWSSDSHYVVNGIVTARPVNPTVLDQLTLLNVPAPCKMFINETPYHINDSTVELELPMSTKYSIFIESFPFLDAEFEIET